MLASVRKIMVLPESGGYSPPPPEPTGSYAYAAYHFLASNRTVF